ncbi:serine/threonine protein kinase [Aquabacterium sp. A7-Y]|uniref:serine/threonine protein kinase n=1 Tax=Aquabacterium sp. A7-Y TaxID=1349605 RepID=UPI00223D7097|nr:serine/threonine-protein kinase [Aquabacterium sp. A7-Y]MCW7536578.1 serine/threonine protein kinase [Aquabacterium sp. A7-Y]
MSVTPLPAAFAPAPGSPPPAVSYDQDALPGGTRLFEFEIQKVIGSGGFAIVYLAFDHGLERQVAIKEYMPAALAVRGPGGQVALRSRSHQETFSIGLRSFVNEAKLLARFDHPSLVRVYRFWRANNTGYMVMPYYEGITLQAACSRMSAPPKEAWLRALLRPLLGALEEMHAKSCFHRDIAPDNILLLKNGRPVLLDFGAARRVISDRTQNLTAILKPSYAPIEQYADASHLKQGPWTDLYALAAVVHYCLSHEPPLPSAARAIRDQLKPAREVGRRVQAAFPGRRQYSDSFLGAIDWALAVRPQERPQSVAVFRAALDGLAGPQTRVAAAPATTDAASRDARAGTAPAREPRSGGRAAVRSRERRRADVRRSVARLAAMVTLFAALLAVGAWWLVVHKGRPLLAAAAPARGGGGPLAAMGGSGGLALPLTWLDPGRRR